ncbi:DUF3592 domain-containing protein [Viridibacterium curvum]|uniref:DUF3592 domain-containing protein n=1 Tax=Viridibacterium curvum TaxID=1101404 RepID=A0ABP9QXS6_9RHOO
MPTKRSISPRTLSLLAIPFLLVGLAFFVMGIVASVVDWSRMQDWHPLEAQLLSAGLEQRGSRTRTWLATARYRYQFGGKTYIGQRVAINESADNIGDFQQTLGFRLRGAMRAGQSVQIWVNPQNPAEAVIDRSLRGSLMAYFSLFVVLFGGVGAGILIFARRTARARSAVAGGPDASA